MADDTQPGKMDKEKGPLAKASGPSLGRKRPRRAAIAKGYRTATICDCGAQKARLFSCNFGIAAD